MLLCLADRGPKRWLAETGLAGDRADGEEQMCHGSSSTDSMFIVRNARWHGLGAAPETSPKRWSGLVAQRRVGLFGVI